MIKSITAKLSLLFLLTAITTCYYERETDQIKVCFVRGNSIWTMNIDGSEQRQITFPVIGSDKNPSWSPDGKKIIFNSNRIFSDDKIYVMNSDGSELRQITFITNPADFYEHPTWSSDGERIVFTGIRSSFKYVFVADIDGNIINSFEYTVLPQFLSLSLDGNYLYFTLNNGNYPLFRINLATNDVFNDPLAGYRTMSVSPDGKTLACSNNSNEISLVPTNDLLTTYPQLVSGVTPCWTPDGETILYVSSSNIYSINIDGTNNKQLTTDGLSSFPCVQGKPR